METPKGLAVRFVVLSPRLVGVLCEYPVEPIARALLLKYPTATSVAYTTLATILLKLPHGLHIGMENIADFAEFETIEGHYSVREILENGRRPLDSRERRESQQDTLKKMDARNRLLIPPPKTGPPEQVKAETVVGAIGVLFGMGTRRACVTVTAVADLLRCSERVVYSALNKRKLKFQDLVDKYGTTEPLNG